MITAEGVLHIAGKKHFFLARDSLLYDPAGKVTGAIESLRDISRQKESEEKVRRMIEHLPLGLQIFKIAPDGSLLCSGGNPASEEITGIGGRCTPGKPFLDIFPGEEGERIHAICKKIAMEGGRDAVDNVLLSPDSGKKRYNIRMFQTDPGEAAVLYL